MSRGLKNNNPLNIEKSRGNPWKGEIVPSQDVRFAQFESMAHGYRAAFKLLDNYRKLHGCRTLGDFIGRWAPPAENATHSYMAIVAQRTGIGATALLNTADQEQMCRIVAAMSYVENGAEADAEQVAAGWELFRKG